MSVSGITKLRPPVPPGLSSGARQFTVAERWPGSTAPPMPSDRIIDRPGWYAMPTGLGELRVKPDPDIPGMPDCRGVACDGMCANAECLGNHPPNVPLPPLVSAVDSPVLLIVSWIVLVYGVSALVYILANAIMRAN